jgi:hypothetical protein
MRADPLISASTSQALWRPHQSTANIASRARYQTPLGLYRPQLERRVLLRPAELDFLTGLRAELFATDLLAAVLRADLFVASLGFGAGFTARFGLPRELAAAFLGFRTTFATLVTEELRYSLAALLAVWTASFAPSKPDLAASSPACAVSRTVFVTLETMLSCSLSS